jgi:hypothetical protein
MCLHDADVVEVTGVVVRQFGPLIPGMRCQVCVLVCDPLGCLQDVNGLVLSIGTMLAKKLLGSIGLLPIACMQVSLALQAICLVMASEKRSEVEVTPQKAEAFAEFWQAHADCPMIGRNKAGTTGPVVCRWCQKGWPQLGPTVEPVQDGACMHARPLFNRNIRNNLALTCRSWPACAPSCMAC